MNKKSIVFMLSLLLIVFLVACGADQGSEVDEVVNDYDSLVSALTNEGAKVEASDPVLQPFLTSDGKVILVNGQSVQVFEYVDDASAQIEADTISPDGGSTTTTMISWMDTPHFYRAGKLLVLYVGSDAGTLQLLEQVLGPQFAGG